MPLDVIQLLALTMGAAWASGINLYAAVFILGFLDRTGYVALPAELSILGDPMVLFIAGLMYCIEFFADKTPGVDSAWDAIHTFIRIPAGAILAMSAVAPMDPALQVAALLVGGSLAAGSHAAKSGLRLLLNTSPEPFTNWAASISEDLLVVGGLLLALYHPVLFLAALLLFVTMLVWLLPKIWGAIRALASRMNATPAPSGSVPGVNP